MSGPKTWTVAGVARWAATSIAAFCGAIFVEENIRHFVHSRRWDEFLTSWVDAMVSLPTWFWMIFAFSAGVALALWIVRKSPEQEAGKEGAKSGTASEAGSSTGIVDKKKSYLYPDPPSYDLWNAKIIFSRSGTNLEIYLEYTYHSGGLGLGYWSKLRRVFVKGPITFKRGTNINFEIARVDDSKGYRAWRWAFENDDLIYVSTHKCRLVFSIDNKDLDDFWFVMDACDNAKHKEIVFIDEHRFTGEWPEGAV